MTQARTELLRRDRAVAVLVEQAERLLELRDLLLSQLVRHGCAAATRARGGQTTYPNTHANMKLRRKKASARTRARARHCPSGRYPDAIGA
jgi:hypothetical protein